MSQIRLLEAKIHYFLALLTLLEPGYWGWVGLRSKILFGNDGLIGLNLFLALLVHFNPYLVPF